MEPLSFFIFRVSVQIAREVPPLLTANGWSDQLQVSDQYLYLLLLLPKIRFLS